MTPDDPMLRLARAALPLWPIDAIAVTPISVRENAVFSVSLRDGGQVALRVHRPGYHTDAALLSESAWCAALATAGVEVPVLVPSCAGRAFESVAVEGLGPARQVDVFEWIEGRQLGTAESGMTAGDADVAGSYELLGALAAQMHNQSESWPRPVGFVRHRWDGEGLVGEDPLWGRFWELAALTAAQRRTTERLRDLLRTELTAWGPRRNRFGLIHADLVLENVMVTADGLRVIDFDDAGFGWYLFEIATSLYVVHHEPYYPVARDAVIAGYRQHRALRDEEIELLPMFLAARASTYLGWVHTRQAEPAARALTPIILERAFEVVHDYLGR